MDGYCAAYTGIYPPEYLDAFNCREQENDWKAWMNKYPDDVLYVAESDGQPSEIAYGWPKIECVWKPGDTQ